MTSADGQAASARAGAEAPKPAPRIPGAKMASDSDSFKKWKAVVPLLYDWFANHNLTWPSLTCRWGPKLDEQTYKRKYRIYFSEQVGAPRSDEVHDVAGLQNREAGKDRGIVLSMEGGPRVR
ncbi:unnamed protein product [Ostreobium quekettii]|uniref:Histone-binding protein RBBP4-like N-terminal domain-containing protein n=1 Tax=Ostreobium quekettii TaxID=121088 RepID=A0A8S1INU6_9CHLO|nr:unnamed protein product [Ostreobium quekettii]